MEELLKLLPELSEEAKAELEKALANRYEQGKTDQRMEQDKINFDSAVERALLDAGAIDTAISKSVMDFENVLFEGGEILGLGEEIDRVKKEYGFLFRMDCPQFSASSGNDEDIDLTSLNYIERLKLFKENPELYRRYSN